MSPYTKLKLKAENRKLKRAKFISLSTHNASRMFEIIPKKPSKIHLRICCNIEPLLPLQTQMSLYMYTCLSHVLQR